MNRYEEIRPSIKTGDVLLFSGAGPASELIKRGTGSPWSHVGLAIRVDAWDLTLSMESTTLSNVDDLDAGRGVKGIQTVSLSSRVRHYQGRVAVRHLIRPLSPEQVCELAAFRQEFKGRPYEEDKLTMILAALGLPGTTRDLSSVFCSETVAAAMQRLGVFPRGQAPDAFVPRDFSSEARECFEFVNQVYGPERVIKG